MKKLKLQYRDLEQRVFANLRYKVSTSKEYSTHTNEKCIKVNLFDYTELAIINDRLTFLDSNGHHYSVYTDASLEDLIDILNAEKVTE